MEQLTFDVINECAALGAIATVDECIDGLIVTFHIWRDGQTLVRETLASADDIIVGFATSICC